MSFHSTRVPARTSGIAGTQPLSITPRPPARPGALDAFQCPSLVNGVAVQRKAPAALMSVIGHVSLGR